MGDERTTGIYTRAFLSKLSQVPQPPPPPPITLDYYLSKYTSAHLKGSHLTQLLSAHYKIPLLHTLAVYPADLGPPAGILGQSFGWHPML